MPLANSMDSLRKIFHGGFNMDLIFILSLLAVEQAKTQVLAPPIPIISKAPDKPEICIGGT